MAPFYNPRVLRVLYLYEEKKNIYYKIYVYSNTQSNNSSVYEDELDDAVVRNLITVVIVFLFSVIA